VPRTFRGLSGRSGGRLLPGRCESGRCCCVAGVSASLPQHGTPIQPMVMLPARCFLSTGGVFPRHSSHCQGRGWGWVFHDRHAWARPTRSRPTLARRPTQQRGWPRRAGGEGGSHPRLPACGSGDFGARTAGPCRATGGWRANRGPLSCYRSLRPTRRGRRAGGVGAGRAKGGPSRKGWPNAARLGSGACLTPRQTSRPDRNLQDVRWWGEPPYAH